MGYPCVDPRGRRTAGVNVNQTGGLKTTASGRERMVVVLATTGLRPARAWE
jgi:hypothetical protein